MMSMSSFLAGAPKKPLKGYVKFYSEALKNGTIDLKKAPEGTGVISYGAKEASKIWKSLTPEQKKVCLLPFLNDISHSPLPVVFVEISLRPSCRIPLGYSSLSYVFFLPSSGWFKLKREEVPSVISISQRCSPGLNSEQSFFNRSNPERSPDSPTIKQVFSFTRRENNTCAFRIYRVHILRQGYTYRHI
jgi:hypothetical protein